MAKSTSYPTDTTTDDVPDETTSTVEGDVAHTWYVVLHNLVGRWWQGQSINEQHLKGHDIPRLVSLGAIALVGSKEHVQATSYLATTTPDGVDTSEPVKLPGEPADAPASIVLPSGAPAAASPVSPPASATPVIPAAPDATKPS